MTRAIRLLVLALVASCFGCAFHYVEATAPNDRVMAVQYALPAAVETVVLNKLGLKWWQRLPIYLGQSFACRYTRSLQRGEWCHRPEGVGLFLAAGHYLGEFAFIIGRGRIQ
jgi:hypothetical protein